jgi:hypothetical protein
MPERLSGAAAFARPAAQPAPRQSTPLGSRGKEAPTLFDAAPEPVSVEAAVIASAIYREQRDRAARVVITDEQVRKLLAALLAAPANRLDPESAAAALKVAAIQLTGALSQVQRLLNVEQYPVLRRDADGATVVLDAGLLREQFEVGR